MLKIKLQKIIANLLDKRRKLYVDGMVIQKFLRSSSNRKFQALFASPDRYFSELGSPVYMATRKCKISFAWIQDHYEKCLPVYKAASSVFTILQGQLSLQKLWFYIQPCMRTMEILSSIAVAIDKVQYYNTLNQVTWPRRTSYRKSVDTTGKSALK